ncbi:hypothetical protein DKT74_17165 [Streptomyces sp. ZEA17I]|uniref:hypothetical protein n=1 Tax=Streptomyces sp. ZEA17I TaxID=2202516 RepID=UPI000D6FEB10|nr:hypothetical protein [Streptomyces sp. ZEA17I]PWS43348.1 hypothetical protein DKT74_17165 [Streptomyces sp. ZEA17I]
MFALIAYHAVLATGSAVPTTTAPWWGTALGAGIGAIGAGIVSSAVALLNNRASRRQLKQQLDRQEAMLDKQLNAQREQHISQLEAQLRQHSEQLQSQQQDNLAALNAQAERGRQDIEAQRYRETNQRHAEREQWRLEARQKTYVEFVTAAERLRDTVAALSRELSGSFPIVNGLEPGELSRLHDTRTRMHSLYEEAFQQAQVVRLAGPLDVASHARAMSLVMNEYLNLSDERIRAAQQNRPSEVLQDWHDSIRRMQSHLEDFIDAAYLVVNAAPTASSTVSVPTQPARVPQPSGVASGSTQPPVSGRD